MAVLQVQTFNGNSSLTWEGEPGGHHCNIQGMAMSEPYGNYMVVWTIDNEQNHLLLFNSSNIERGPINRVKFDSIFLKGNISFMTVDS